MFVVLSIVRRLFFTCPSPLFRYGHCVLVSILGTSVYGYFSVFSSGGPLIVWGFMFSFVQFSHDDCLIITRSWSLYLTKLLTITKRSMQFNLHCFPVEFLYYNLLTAHHHTSYLCQVFMVIAISPWHETITYSICLYKRWQCDKDKMI